MQEHSSRGIQPNDPSECKHIIQCHQNHWNLGDGNGGPAHRLQERVPLMTTVPLFDSNQSQQSRFSPRLLVLRNLSVIVCFIHDTYNEDERYCPEHCEDPVRPWPGGFPGYETGDEGPEVRGDDYEARPDVDFSTKYLSA